MKDLQNMSAVIAKIKPARDACDELFREYEKRDPEDYSRYTQIEQNVIKYINRLPKQSDVYMKCATLLTNYPMYYKEVPGGMTMEQFCLDVFAAIHPATYVHSNIAKEHESTRDYTDVIMGHHLWYDCSKGYPVKFDTFKSPYKTIIDLVTAADCLDAATDTVGRSYNRGKTFSDYEQEITEGSGTRYAPFLPELFKQPELRKEIEYLLDTGRKKIYRESFYLLKGATFSTEAVL